MATRRYLPSTDIVNYHDQIELHCTSTYCPVHDFENDNRNYLSFESDEFRMYSFKVLMCHKTYSHDWTSCPYTHRGERARRRPPYRYLPIQCPYFEGDDTCRRGNSCKLAHGIFEYWLHPGKYRTAMCTNGTRCDRKVCFFAHTPEELREEMSIQGDERYLAFITSNVQMPVVVPPRHAGRVASNTNYAPVSPYVPGPFSGSPGNSGAAFSSTSRHIAAMGDNTRNFNNFGTPSSSIFGSSLPDLSSLPYNFNDLSSVLKEIEEQGKAASASNNGCMHELDWNLVEPFEWDNDSFWK